MNRVNVKLSDEHYHKLKLLAAQDRRSLSNAVRWIVEHWLDQTQHEPEQSGASTHPLIQDASS